MNFNKVVLVGRLTSDPQSRFTNAGTPVSTFTLAVNRDWDSGVADFIRVTAFGGVADVASNYLSKGRLVLVEGAIRTRNWEDNAGQRHYVTEVVAEKIRILEKREQQAQMFEDQVDESWGETDSGDPDAPPF